MKRVYAAIAIAALLISMVLVLSDERFACSGSGTLASIGVERTVSRISSKPYVYYLVAFTVGARTYWHRGVHDVAPTTSNWGQDEEARAIAWMASHSVGELVTVKYHCHWPMYAVTSLGDMASWPSVSRTALSITVGSIALFAAGAVLLFSWLRRRVLGQRHARVTR